MTGVRVVAVIILVVLRLITSRMHRRRRRRATGDATPTAISAPAVVASESSLRTGHVSATPLPGRVRTILRGVILLGVVGLIVTMGLIRSDVVRLADLTTLNGPLPWVSAGVVLLVIGAYLLWMLPTWRLASARESLTPKEYLEIENNFRLAIIQAIGGIALLAGLYFTWQQANDARQTANETLRISQEGQITDRFTRAIDQLGSDAPEVRLGGIYALERIARDSAVDGAPVLDILAAFIRQRAPWKGDLPSAFATPQSTTDHIVASDVRAALLVIGRHHPVQEGAPCADLSNTNLSGLQLNVTTEDVTLNDVCFISANLTWTFLFGSDLTGSRFELANLADANLGSTTLTDATFDLATLQDADLSFATLTDASFYLADLSGANLAYADLTGANFEGAILTGADLRGANLDAALGLTQAQLDLAITDAATPVP